MDRDTKGGRKPLYPLRLPAYDNEEGLLLLHALAGRWGNTCAGTVRQLIRQAAAREGVTIEEGQAHRDRTARLRLAPPAPREEQER